jgi:hypothetical protein
MNCSVRFLTSLWKFGACADGTHDGCGIVHFVSKGLLFGGEFTAVISVEVKSLVRCVDLVDYFSCGLRPATSLVVLVGECCGISRRCRHVGECWRSTLDDSEGCYS